VTVPAGIDEPRRRVNEETQAPERALAFQAGDEVVGERDALESRPEDELARVEDERLLRVSHLDELGQVLHRLLDVDEGVTGVAEDPKEAVDANVHAGRLNELLVEGVDRDAALFDQAADGAIGQDHGSRKI